MSEQNATQAHTVLYRERHIKCQKYKKDNILHVHGDNNRDDNSVCTVLDQCQTTIAETILGYNKERVKRMTNKLSEYLRKHEEKLLISL